MVDMGQRRSDLSEVAKQIWQPLVILLLSTGNRTDPNEDLLFHCFLYVLCVCVLVFTRGWLHLCGCATGSQGMHQVLLLNLKLTY